MKFNKNFIHTILIFDGGNGFHKKLDGHQFNKNKKLRFLHYVVVQDFNFPQVGGGV